ncbi:hypothetical protein HY478_01530 [Candidatus Uhrbacteria bacterium]|nr:hypothetical protein [Candidatus Uhrbacteria bacterium]
MWKRVKGHEIDPDEIFLDSSNLPGRDDPRLEARVVGPLERNAIIGVGVAFVLTFLTFSARVFDLGIINGNVYADVSRENRLEHSVLFATRGSILDRAGKKLAWSEALPASSSPFALRRYSALPGFSLLLGFVRYPKADARGAWWREETTGISGVEGAYDSVLGGANGRKMIEIDALGNVEALSLVEPPQDGDDVTLSIDAEVQSKLFTLLSEHGSAQGFVGGAAVIMDVRSGELLALVSFPEYNNRAFTDGAIEEVQSASSDIHSPLLNRAISGLYTPGSIVKPIFAAAALNEDIITPEKEIFSTGAITIPNPYYPDRPSIYRDWTVHGQIDMREALAVSSDEYFYTIGGGYEAQKGLGIQLLDEYARLFGLGAPTGIALAGEAGGVIPTPEWKEKVFGDGEQWLLGNTYHTAIGQYGFQVTPIQAAVFTAAIANGGKILQPVVLANAAPRFRDVGISKNNLQVVKEGMRLAVTSPRWDATVKILNIPGIQIAAKTGTAQIGAHNEFINSWSVGFWPSRDPHYAYAAVLEKAPAGTLSGAAPALRSFFEWLVWNKPEYIN